MNTTIIEPNLIAITSKYMDNNSYIIVENNEALIIDPSFNGKDIIKTISADVKVKAILLTHAHFDHCYDTKMLVDKYHCPVYLHEADKDTYFKYRYDNLADVKVQDFANDIIWFNKKELQIGSFNLSTILSPGHTSGSVIYIYKNYVFVGDTLFYNSYGRTDLGNSNPSDIIKSLKKLWKELKDSNLILTGHNRWGKFEEIKKYNFMVKELIE